MTAIEKAKSYLARYALPTGSRQNESQEYTLVRGMMNEHHELVRQQEEVTDMCIVSWVSTMGTLKEKVIRLIQWETAVALDPAVSCDAQRLINQGRKEALDAVFQINGPSRAIKQLREKFGLET